MTLPSDLLTKARDAARPHYDQPHRHYHNWAHIEEMLSVADTHGLVLTPAQHLAILWHDAVYVPGLDKGMNEKASALLMRDQMFREGWPAGSAGQQLADEAVSIILDTIEHMPSSEASKVVLDLDLYRLSVDAAEFDRHAAAIRDEYAALLARAADPDMAWREGRAAIYASFLERERIYFSEDGGRWEAGARGNLERGVGELGG
ncbi:hypothetical protein [Cupriavidus pauculus]|uniref:HD domain-containing protein n=1 Tax=Cupriavidus pauculus TaxID=82633 RepID=UPI001EE287A8|nr:hypothetical protein [Cupriavidus pauculus]GJG94714.1 hypothetical protein CBA19C6_09515 [Cupriavidus pauculus]